MIINEFVFSVFKKIKILIEKSIFILKNRIINNFTNLFFKSQKSVIKSIKSDKITRFKKRLYFFNFENKIETFKNVLINELKRKLIKMKRDFGKTKEKIENFKKLLRYIQKKINIHDDFFKTILYFEQNIVFIDKKKLI